MILDLTNSGIIYEVGLSNLVPSVSHLTAPWSERRETLVQAGHVSPRIWEMTIKLLKGWAA